MKKENLGFFGYLKYSFKHNWVFTFEVFSLPYQWIKCIKKNKSISCRPRFTLGGVYKPKSNQECYKIEVISETHVRQYLESIQRMSESFEFNDVANLETGSRVRKHNVVNSIILEKCKQLA